MNDIPEFRDSFQFEVFEFPDQIYVNFDEVSPDEICISTFHNEPVWRCATVVAPAPAPDTFASLDQPQENIPYLSRMRDSGGVYESRRSSSRSLIEGVEAPELPVLLMPTHFEVKVSLNIIIDRMELVLNSTGGLSFERKNLEVTL